MKIQIKTLMSLVLAAALTACSPFTDDPVNSNVGEGVVLSESNGVLSATITDLEGVDTAAGVTYAWFENGVLIEGATASGYTLLANQSADDITVSVSYIDLAGNTEGFFSPETASDPSETTSNQFASITDTDDSDSGELRYKFPSGMSTGKASFTITYPASETETFYMTLFDTNTNNAGMIGELQMDEGKFKNRVSGSSTTITGPTFTPGTPVSVVLKWDTAAASPMYTIEIDDSFSQSYTAENVAEVTHLSLKLSSNGGTSDYAVHVDDLAIYSDQAGTTQVFSDDFEGYDVGHDLDADPYNSSTFSAVVAGTEATTPTTITTNQVASITDTDESDSGELRYKLPSGQTAGKVSLSVLYPAGEDETFYVTLMDTNTNNAGMIGELQMDEGKYKNRVSGSTTTITGPTFTPGTPVSIVITWDTSDSAAAYYTFELDGGSNFYQSYTAENAAAVTHLSLKLSSNGGTSDYAIEVDDLMIYSDEAGTAEVFSDDFDDYSVGHDLDDSPYNSSTFSAVVAVGSNQAD